MNPAFRFVSRNLRPLYAPPRRKGTSTHRKTAAAKHARRMRRRCVRRYHTHLREARALGLRTLSFRDFMMALRGASDVELRTYARVWCGNKGISGI